MPMFGPLALKTMFDGTYRGQHMPVKIIANLQSRDARTRLSDGIGQSTDSEGIGTKYDTGILLGQARTREQDQYDG